MFSTQPILSKCVPKLVVQKDYQIMCVKHGLQFGSRGGTSNRSVQTGKGPVALVRIGSHGPSLVRTGPHWSALVCTGRHWFALARTCPLSTCIKQI